MVLKTTNSMVWRPPFGQIQRFVEILTDALIYFALPLNISLSLTQMSTYHRSNLGDVDVGDAVAGDVGEIVGTIDATPLMVTVEAETAEGAVEDGDVAEAGDVDAGRWMAAKLILPTAIIPMMNLRP
jgi:hypothetical protein